VTLLSYPSSHERPRTPTQYDIFEKAFENSSPPTIPTLQKANSVLNRVLEAREVLNTPTTQYIQKLANETERLNIQSIIQQRETDNLRAIIQTRRTRMKGKRAILKGHFHISTEELRSQVVEAEEATTQRATKQGSTTTKQAKKVVLIESEVEEDIEELYDSDIDELGW
jgi:hypothetical protein